MEVRANPQAQERYAPSARIYAPMHGSIAYAYQNAAAEALPTRREKRQPEPEQKPLERRRVRRQPLTNAGKLLLILSILVISASGLLVISGYERIAAEYKVVNQLKKDIDQTELRLAELNVALECAVNLDDAKAAAKRMGMTYPTAEQYVQVGNALPDSD